MKSRVEEAAGRHAKGYNCSQAVVCTYCDLLGVEEKTAFRMSEGFGAGMGDMELFAEKCGSAVCKEIKGIESGQPKYGCRDCVRAASAIAEEVLFGEEG